MSFSIVGLFHYFVGYLMTVFVMVFLFEFSDSFFLSRVSVLNFKLKKIVWNSIPSSSLLGNELIILSLFFPILLSNCFSLMCFTFSSTSHISFVMPFTMIMWCSIVSCQICYFSSIFIMNLTPTGTPMVLIPFIASVELISHLARPLTLGVRLMANLTAGHLIFSFCSGTSIIWIFFQMPVLCLETLVSFIQSFVLSMLCISYLNEV